MSYQSKFGINLTRLRDGFLWSLVILFQSKKCNYNTNSVQFNIVPPPPRRRVGASLLSFILNPKSDCIYYFPIDLNNKYFYSCSYLFPPLQTGRCQPHSTPASRQRTGGCTRSSGRLGRLTSCWSSAS